MAKRGRKAKQILSQEEQEQVVINKYANYEPMNLEETALALWMHEGKKNKPLTKMGLLKIEQRALSKLRKICEAKGLHFDNVFSLNSRSCASMKFESEAEY